MTSILCKVTKLQQVNEHVYDIELTSDQPFSFKAGQYLQVVVTDNDNDKRPFSIASAPDQTRLQLHIGASVANSYAMQVVELCKENEQITVEVGLGEAYLRQDSDRPILLIAGGTGFSYVQSIALHLAKIKPQHQVLLYWGCKTPSAFYALEDMITWAFDHPHFAFIPVVEQPDQQWQGKTGYVHLAAMDDIANLMDYDIYIAGHFDMVKIVRDDYLAHGAIREHMFADAFSYIR